MPVWESSEYDPIYSKIAPAYQGWPRWQALADFYEARGGKLENLPAGYGEQYRTRGISSVAPVSTLPGQTAPQVDYVSLAKQMLGLQQEFRQPAIQTLEAGRGQIPQVFAPQKAAIEAEREPLQQRYQNLLADITKTTREATAAEFARRGIPLSSGIVEKTIGERMAPQIERVGLEREASLRKLTELATGLAGQEAQMGLNLNQAIATIQAATGQSAVDAALTLYNLQQQQRQAGAQMTVNQALQALREREQALAESEATWKRSWQEKLWQYELAKPYYEPTTGVSSPLSLEQIFA